jgi:threonyl-tRNA synthetase
LTRQREKSDAEIQRGFETAYAGALDRARTAPVAFNLQASRLVMQTPPFEKQASQDAADFLSRLRHSAAHVMADAVRRLRPQAKVAIGPAIEDGFYYDFETEP